MFFKFAIGGNIKLSFRELKAFLLIFMVMFICSGCSNISVTKTIKSKSNKMLENVQVSNEVKAQKYMNMLQKYDKKDIFKVDGQYIELKTYGKDVGQWIKALKETGTVYVGNLKDGRPEGEGIVFERKYIGEYQCWTPTYIGEFSNGKLNGYGIEISYMIANTVGEEKVLINYICREGEFDEGRINGKVMFQSGHDAMGPWTDSISSHYSGIEKYVDMSEPIILSDELTSTIVTNTLKRFKEIIEDNTILISEFYPYTLPFYYKGEAKNSYCNGDGSFYYNRSLVYTGEFKKGAFNGKGTLYNIDGTVKYSGNFKKGAFNGKGTLYNTDGTVKYSGKWKDGKIK